MDAGGARQKLFVISFAVILGTAAWLPFAGSVNRPKRNPRPPAATALFEPERQSDVPGFIAACWAADAEEIPRLRELAQTETSLVVGRAIAALGRLRSLHDDPRLLAYLRDPRDRVRHETIIGLGASGEKRVVPLLLPILEGGEPQARLLAISALGQLGAHDELTRLLQAPATDAITRAFVRGALHPADVPPLLSTTTGLK
jgi:hypothetical protein